MLLHRHREGSLNIKLLRVSIADCRLKDHNFCLAVSWPAHSRPPTLAGPLLCFISLLSGFDQDGQGTILASTQILTFEQVCVYHRTTGVSKIDF